MRVGSPMLRTVSGYCSRSGKRNSAGDRLRHRRRVRRRRHCPNKTYKDYIWSSVRELVPFIWECYETSLATKPTLAGTVVVNFTIEGEPETGGLVTECVIDDSSDMTLSASISWITSSTATKDPEFRECMRETMFALEIDPPRNGGAVEVVYPFTFRLVDEP